MTDLDKIIAGLSAAQQSSAPGGFPAMKGK